MSGPGSSPDAGLGLTISHDMSALLFAAWDRWGKPPAEEPPPEFAAEFPAKLPGTRLLPTAE
jgi:hypothetical protein